MRRCLPFLLQFSCAISLFAEEPPAEKVLEPRRIHLRMPNRESGTTFPNNRLLRD